MMSDPGSGSPRAGRVFTERDRESGLRARRAKSLAVARYTVIRLTRGGSWSLVARELDLTEKALRSRMQRAYLAYDVTGWRDLQRKFHELGHISSADYSALTDPPLPELS